MPRVNIESHATVDSRFHKLMKHMGWDRPTTIGVLYLFWHDSQQRLISAGTRDEIQGCFPPEVDDQERFFDCLVRIGYIVTDTDSDRFCVKGNERQIQYHEIKREAGRRGGIESGKSRRTISDTNQDDRSTASKQQSNIAKLEADPIRSDPTRSDPIRSEKERSPAASAAGRAAPPCLLELWQKNAGELPQAKEISEKRRRAWNERWRTKPDAVYWASVIRRLAASAFCSGRGPRGWKADVDFFLRPDTHLKALEGKYDGPIAKSPTYAEAISIQNQQLYDAVDRGEA